MTPNSEQVKAIAEKVYQISVERSRQLVPASVLEQRAHHEHTLQLITEALSQQPTGDGLDEPEALKRFNALMDAEKPTPDITASAEEVFGKYVFSVTNDARGESYYAVDYEGFTNALSEATAELRRELEQLRSRIIKQDHWAELTKRMRRREELTAENEQLRKELEDSKGLADVIQNVMTPDLCPIDTNELGQNAYFIYRMYWAIDAKNRELTAERDRITAEVERLKREIEEAFYAGQRSMDDGGKSFDQWKESRGKA